MLIGVAALLWMLWSLAKGLDAIESLLQRNLNVMASIRDKIDRS
jgi:hypothetical protein